MMMLRSSKDRDISNEIYPRDNAEVVNRSTRWLKTDVRVRHKLYNRENNGRALLFVIVILNWAGV